MGGQSVLKELIHHQDEVAYSFTQIAENFGHSFFLGSILTFVTYFSLTYAKPASSKKKLSAKKRAKYILGSFNILFLCVGLTGLMILVNNSLARAFAIGAALGIVRFRVKLGQKSLVSNILFGIITGIACGLEMLSVAWIVTGVYTLLQIFLIYILGVSHSEDEDNDKDDDSELVN